LRPSGPARCGLDVRRWQPNLASQHVRAGLVGGVDPRFMVIPRVLNTRDGEGRRESEDSDCGNAEKWRAHGVPSARSGH
jgi:hypothetical protein